MSDQINPGVVVGVRMMADRLTDDELSALYMVATFGNDPTPVMGYEKAKSLFTQHNGTRMHPDTLAVLGVIVDERLR